MRVVKKGEDIFFEGDDWVWLVYPELLCEGPEPEF